jgi:DNA invertase Pin-like site-specific DNA recombinase
MIAYYRVSTARQGHSGLGLEAQKADVQDYLERSACDLVAEYVEVETGKKHGLDNRPELKKAIAQAKRAKAILVVAKLDRLLRSTVVRTMLKTSGVRFVACDNPHANELTIDILAAVAEDEVRRISARTKAALAAYKARGGRLGASLTQCRNLTDEARRKGARAAGASHVRNANEAYHDVTEIISELRDGGASLREIAADLNAGGFTTRRGRPWNAVQVARVLSRAEVQN